MAHNKKLSVIQRLTLQLDKAGISSIIRPFIGSHLPQMLALSHHRTARRKF